MMMLDSLIRYKSHVKRQSFFIRQLAAMLGAGMNAVEALEILEEKKEKEKFKGFQFFTKTRFFDKEGGSVFEKSPEWFRNLLAAITAKGDGGKDVAEIMHAIADDQENIENMKKRIISVLIYPTVVFFTVALILGILMVFVIPSYVSFYSSFGDALPGPTRQLLNFFMFIKEYWIPVLLAVAVIAKLATLKAVRDTVLYVLSLTGYGYIINSFSVLMFSRCLAVMMCLKTPVDKALETAVGAVPNLYHSRRLKAAVSGRNETSSLTEALEATGLYSPLTLRLLKAGEKSGTLEMSLKELSRYQEKDLSDYFDALMKTSEVVLLLLLSILVGYIVISLYLPLFDMGGIVGG